MTRYPMRAFYEDGSSILVHGADEELALKPGWKDTPEAFAPGYVAPPASPFVPTANLQMMQALSEIEQARMRQEAVAVTPAVIPDSKLAAIEQQFEKHALEMITLKARLGTLETAVRDLEARLADIQAGAVAFSTPADVDPVPVTPVVEKKPPTAAKAKKGE